MKKILSLFLVGMVLSCTNSPAQKQNFKEHITKEFAVSSTTTLNVYNIDGFIKVEGYDGNKIILEIDKTISGKTEQIIEQGKSEFKLNFEQINDEITAYISEPYDSRPNLNNRNNKDLHIEYNVRVNYTIKVPYSTNLKISTINNGDINVLDVKGEIKANNINGAITLKNVSKAYDVHTINGNVDINYLTLPPDNAKYYTLNGDLTVVYPANLSADCSFKSFQGEFYTDFPEVEVMPAKIKKIVEKDGESTRHKLEKGSNIKIGKGGLKLNFETFNGNIYIKKV